MALVPLHRFKVYEATGGELLVVFLISPSRLFEFIVGIVEGIFDFVL